MDEPRENSVSGGSTGLSRNPEINTIHRWGTPAPFLVHDFAKDRLRQILQEVSKN